MYAPLSYIIVLYLAWPLNKNLLDTARSKNPKILCLHLCKLTNLINQWSVLNTHLRITIPLPYIHTHIENNGCAIQKIMIVGLENMIWSTGKAKTIQVQENSTNTDCSRVLRKNGWSNTGRVAGNSLPIAFNFLTFAPILILTNLCPFQSKNQSYLPGDTR